ncbi:protein FMC1 homolog [Leptopilina heterotoma]|uniref:protein FMC1 homolog n=1 Tax=Leptopilina heterotoma TaxID=63436 RepID=UPI001CA82D81|nr:protein FMC1 homolog [Leptopilina heterotoma]
MNSELKVVRSLLQGIKNTSQWKTLGDKRMVQYILKETRVHKETCEIYCKAREELKTLADNYLLYLTSRQKYEDIQRQFSGKGERSVQEVAELVGFKLPNSTK